MTWPMWLALAADLALAVAGPWLARVLPPRHAVRLLVPAMLAAAAGAGLVLGALGLLAVAELPQVAALGRWSAPVLRARDGVPPAAGAAAAVVVLVLLTAAVVSAAGRARLLVRSARACRALPAAPGGLVILEHDEPDAYALPGVPGRVVVTTALLRALPAAERRALLAHEAAHLAGHHHLFVQLAEVAAAASPVLRPTARAVRLAVEREADECAAREVGDRRLVARALARAGLARAAAGSHGAHAHGLAALAAADGDVPRRARALLSPAPRPRRLLAAALAALTVATLGVTALAARQTDDRLDQAQLAVTAPVR